MNSLNFLFVVININFISCHHKSNYRDGKAYVRSGYDFTQCKRVSNVYKTRNQTFDCD